MTTPIPAAPEVIAPKKKAAKKKAAPKKKKPTARRKKYRTVKIAIPSKPHKRGTGGLIRGDEYKSVMMRVDAKFQRFVYDTASKLTRASKRHHSITDVTRLITARLKDAKLAAKPKEA